MSSIILSNTSLLSRTFYHCHYFGRLTVQSCLWWTYTSLLLLASPSLPSLAATLCQPHSHWLSTSSPKRWWHGIDGTWLQVSGMTLNYSMRISQIGFLIIIQNAQEPIVIIVIVCGAVGLFKVSWKTKSYRIIVMHVPHKMLYKTGYKVFKINPMPSHKFCTRLWTDEPSPNDEPEFQYYINEGVYGSFASKLMETLIDAPSVHKVGLSQSLSSFTTKPYFSFWYLNKISGYIYTVCLKPAIGFTPVKLLHCTLWFIIQFAVNYLAKRRLAAAMLSLSF